MTTGDKSENNLVAPLQKADWVVVMFNYRLLHQAPWPACVEDFAAAIAWSRGALASRGVACKRLFIGGLSAGANLAALVTLDRRYLAIHNLDITTCSGLILLSGQMTSHFAYCASIGHPSRGPLIDHYAPLWHVRSDAPKVLLVTGERDLPGRDAENRLMLATMESIGHRHTTHHTIPGREHGNIAEGLGDPNDPVHRILHRFLGIHFQESGRSST